MTMLIWRLGSLLKATFRAWREDNAPRLAAALAYYTLLSLAPLLVIAVAIAGLAFGEEAARGQLSTQLTAAAGPEAGQALQSILAHASTARTNTLATVVGIVVLLFGASGVFGELQSALDTIWDVQPRPGRGLKGIVRDRFLSFTMVLVVAFLLLVSLVLSTILSALGEKIAEILPGGALLWKLVNIGVSFLLVAFLFALIFKVVPDVHVAWRDVSIGAVVTALLFTLGKFALGEYLGRSTVASPYGAAGSVVVLVVWVYYATQILLFGAEFTQVYACRYGSRFTPTANAVNVRVERHPRLTTA